MDRSRICVVVSALAVATVGCAGADSSSSGSQSPSPQTPVASPSASPSAFVEPSPNTASPDPGAHANATIESFDDFVASIDPLIRESSIAGEWTVTFTLVTFNGEGVDYRPYLPIGGTEEWTWTVTPRCEIGPCDVRYEATSGKLSGVFPSSLRWSVEGARYFSEGMTALAQANCRDEGGRRIPDSYQVRQNLLIVPITSAGPGGDEEATQLAGLRVDKGMPVAGMPANCGTFTEGWRMEANRPE